MEYYFEKQVDYSVDEAIGKISELLKTHGFGILTQIDVQKTLHDKIGAEIRPYRILGACNPNFANIAVSKERNIGLMLPCNIVVQQSVDGHTMVSTINPERTIKSIGNEHLYELADNVQAVMKALLNELCF